MKRLWAIALVLATAITVLMAGGANFEWH